MTTETLDQMWVRWTHPLYEFVGADDDDAVQEVIASVLGRLDALERAVEAHMDAAPGPVADQALYDALAECRGTSA